jgi:hypothetical protein
VSERDSKRIVRQWNREIDEDERRRTDTRNTLARGPWRIVSWAALWLLWLVLIAALVAHARHLG